MSWLDLRRTRWPLAAVLAAAVAIAVLTALDWPAREYRNDDFFQFYAGSSAVVEGASPYDVPWTVTFADRVGSNAVHTGPGRGPGDPEWTTPYPLPLFLLLAPLAFLPIGVAAAVWLVGQVAAVAAGLVLIGRAVLREPRRDGLVVAGIALAFQPLWLLPGSGQVTGFLFGIAAGATAAALAGRAMTAGAILALAMVKPQSLVVLGLALLLATPRRAWPRFAAGLAIVGLPLLAASFALRPGWVPEWLASVAALQATSFSNATGWTLARAIPGAPPALGPIAVVASVAFLLAWAYRARPAPAWLVAAAVPVSVFAAPHGWTYEQLYLLIPAVIIVGAVAALGPPARAGFLVTLAAVYVLVPWLLYAWDLGHNGEEASALVPILVLGLVLATQRAMGDDPSRARTDR